MAWKPALVRALTPRSRLSAIVVGIALFALVGRCDWVTGPQFDFSLFYLIPTCYFAWYLGKWFGFAAAVLSTFLWYRMDALWTGVGPYQISSRLSTRIVFFCCAVLLFQVWRN